MRIIPLLIVPILATSNLQAQDNKSKRKPSPVFAPVKDNSNLPRVLLIGDSISIGYTLPTRKLLMGKANLHRIPTNGGPTTKGLAEIDKWLGKSKWDVIHFNWGLHDLKYMGPNGQNLFPKEKGGKPQVPIDAYEKNLDKLVTRLKKTGAKLIWRNTTPVPPGSKGRYVGDSVKYNAAATRVMKKHGVPTHDLFTMSKKRMKEIMRPANVHYSPEGSKVLGRDVARVITEALKK
jgi:acyl-CoA thioesterase-1